MARRNKFPWGLALLGLAAYLYFEEKRQPTDVTPTTAPGPSEPALLPYAPTTMALLPAGSSAPGAATSPALNTPVIQQQAQQTTMVNPGTAQQQPATLTYTTLRNGTPTTIQRFNPF